MITWDEAERIFREADPRFEAWSVAQREAYVKSVSLLRQLLFFPTGKGKTKTALGILAAKDRKRIVVVAPLKTHGDWRTDLMVLGFKDFRIDTPQKFRMQNTSYSKETDAFIVDEFHQLGGHGAAGWKKFNRMMRHFTGDVVMMSATPNYNDAERVFCLTAIGDAAPNRNYLDWLWDNCNCHVNRFSRIPDVDEDDPFKQYESAIDFLLSRDWVSYIEDTAQWSEDELIIPNVLGHDYMFESLNANKRSKKLMNSEMEKRHARVNRRYIGEDGLIRPEILNAVSARLAKNPDRHKWLVFCAHKTVAEALYKALDDNVWLITGDTGDSDGVRREFINAQGGWLIGTTAIATGLDGIDKVCTSMLILDDLDGDPSLRRQLIGRILPRGGHDARVRLVITATF